MLSTIIGASPEDQLPTAAHSRDMQEPARLGTGRQRERSAARRPALARMRRGATALVSESPLFWQARDT